MKQNHRIMIAALLAVLAAGCGGQDHSGHDHAQDHGAAEIELFEKNRGVRLPAELQQDLGVATVEVAEKPVTRNFEKMAHIFRATAGDSPAGAVAWLEDNEAGQVRVGQRVAFRVRSARASVTEGQGRGIASVGTIVRLDPSPDPASRRREVLMELNDADNRFPVGSRLEAVFSSEHSHSALTVPDSAVIRGAGGPFVYAANGGHFVRTSVKTGARVDGWIEITDGLYAGDTVVARAVDSLWLIELCALKGGSPCCPVPTKKRHE